MGFIVNLKGEKSHGIVEKGLQILKNLEHRGACGCDPETGDGAGILIQIPHEFFARELPFALPAPGQYGVGMMFLPVEPRERLLCEGWWNGSRGMRDLKCSDGAIRRLIRMRSVVRRGRRSRISNRFSCAPRPK